MVPYTYKMVDMKGVDLAYANGSVVEGIYQSVLDSINACGVVILYNWKFADIEIVPTHVDTIVVEDESITINNVIVIGADDTVSISGIIPPPADPTIIPLEAHENREYLVPEGVDGFNPVNVSTPTPSDFFCEIVLLQPINKTFYIKYGTDFTYSGTIVVNNKFYLIDIELDSVTVNFEIDPHAYAKPAITNYEIVQVYGNFDFVASNKDLIVTANESIDGCGVVLSGESDLSAKYNEYRYTQAGTCGLSATLPSIVRSGSGRIYFTSPPANTNFTISYVSGQNFFISGNPYVDQSFIIYNFFA